jgi:hypothetical protein
LAERLQAPRRGEDHTTHQTPSGLRSSGSSFRVCQYQLPLRLVNDCMCNCVCVCRLRSGSKLVASKALPVALVIGFIVRHLGPSYELTNELLQPSAQDIDTPGGDSGDSGSTDTTSNKHQETAQPLPPMEECFSILCRGQVLPTNMTLATIKAFHWKGSNDILTLTYQRSPSTAHIPLRFTPLEKVPVAPTARR